MHGIGIGQAGPYKITDRPSVCEWVWNHE